MEAKKLSQFLLGTSLSLLIASCAHKTNQNVDFSKLPQSDVSLNDWAKQGLTELSKGNYSLARSDFARGLRYEPGNCQLNFFNGLSYQYQGRGGDQKLLDMAAVGYGIAIRQCPRDPWPHYYYGTILMQQKNYQAAEQQFAMASQYANSSDIGPFLEGYLASAYNSGDNQVATQLLNKLRYLDPNSPLVQQVARNLQTRGLPAPQFTSSMIPPPTINNNTYLPPKRSKAKAPQLAKFTRTKKQVIVDAVLIENREVSTETRGINLLNGLSIQYGNGTTPGFSYVSSQFNSLEPWNRYTDAANNNSTYPQVPFPELITNTISIPAVTYSLDIFNNDDEQAEVLARPSLIAEDGQTATYFSGQKLILGITGQQAGSIETFPIGLDMDLTPAFQPDGSINIKVAVGIEFLQNISNTGNNTTFSQVAQALSQKTTTTVNLHFGETAILSALSTDIDNSSTNRTPVLGDVPLVGNLFKHKVTEKQSVSILVLLTPQPYISFASMIDGNVSKQTQEYYNRLVAPRTNISNTLRELTAISLYTRPAVDLPSDGDTAVLNQSVRDELKQLQMEN